MSKFRNLIDYIYEKDGILYELDRGEYKPIPVCLHDGTGDGFLSRSSARGMGWEADDSGVSIPSYCLRFDLDVNHGYDDDVVDVIMDFFKEELDAADHEFIEYATPLEKESIQLDFDRFLEDEGREETDDETITRYIRWYKRIPIDFHDEDEIRDICRECL